MRDFALALSPNYRLASARVGEVTVNSYYLAGDEGSGRAALDAATQAVQVYGELFGPYPYTEMNVAETSFVVEGMPGGMEFPGIVFISSELYRPGLFADELDTVVVHEVAHQWWYGVVGDDEVADPWLDEAFATYSSILFFEKTQGKEKAQEEMSAQGQLPWLMTVMTSGDRPVGTSLLEFDDLISYSGIVYGKGAVFLARLRETLGDEAFFAMLRRYYAGHKYGVVQPQDFLQAIRETPKGEQGAAIYDRYVLQARGMDDEDMAGLGGLADALKLLMGGKELSPQDLEQLLQQMLKKQGQ
jgi:aminopeptidase N